MFSLFRCLERLHRWHPEQVHMIDGTHGGTALHWARNKEVSFSNNPYADGGSFGHYKMKKKT